MGRSNNKRGPDFRVLRPDLENARKACDKPVRTWELENGTSIDFYPDEDSVESSPREVWIDPELRTSES